jgi:hypothetical protein
VDGTETTRGASAREQGEQPEPRWFQRVLPVMSTAVALVALAAVVFPGFRHQLVLSASRQPQPFVELSFPNAASEAHDGCAGSDTSVGTRFTVTSHLTEPRRLAYRVSVTPTGDGHRTRHSSGSLRIAPGRSREVRASFPVPPSEAYTVSVRLPELGQLLRAHCQGPSS